MVCAKGIGTSYRKPTLLVVCAKEVGAYDSDGLVLVGVVTTVTTRARRKISRRVQEPSE